MALFLGTLEDVLASEPVFHEFPGVIETDVASTIWTWVARDIAAGPMDMVLRDAAAGGDAQAAFAAALPDLLASLKANDEAEKIDPDLMRRNTIQMGGEAARRRLPLVVVALRRRPLLVQARLFGSAVGAVGDEVALAEALQTIAIGNPLTRALWMQAMVAHMSNPGRTLAAVVSLAGGQSEAHIINAGYGPLVEAMLCHAQGQIGHLAAQASIFADIDFACKAIERFHRLMRALNYSLDIDRKSRWGKIIADLTGRMSERLERPLQGINASITLALRKPKGGTDQIDSSGVLEAFNGLYLLSVTRRARDSLAVNAVLEKAWSETGRTLEVLITRALDAYRLDPANATARERIDAGITMAEIRFNAEYADILRRARDGAERRAVSSQA